MEKFAITATVTFVLTVDKDGQVLRPISHAETVVSEMLMSKTGFPFYEVAAADIQSIKCIKLPRPQFNGTPKKEQ